MIGRFPKDAEMRLNLSSVFMYNLGSQFKAIFELMYCDFLDLTFKQKFVVFKSKQQIETDLIA